MKLFLSYCHKDESHKDDFRKHASVLEKSGMITMWHDREIVVGESFQQRIDENLEEADIIVFFVSAEFLNSDFCQAEMDRALELAGERGVDMMPIIISPCDWQNSKIGNVQSAPTDGKAVELWGNKNQAWTDIVKHLRILLDKHACIKKEPTEEFRGFADRPGSFVSSSRSDVLRLRDLYVHPMLDRHLFDANEVDASWDQKSARFLTEIGSVSEKIVMVLGDDFSGKTALCQMIYGNVPDSGNGVPVYIDGGDVSNDNWDQIEKIAFERQYKYLRKGAVKNNEKIIVFDNFGDDMKPRDVLSLLSKLSNGGYRMVALVASTMNSLFRSIKWTKAATQCEVAMYEIVAAGYRERAEIVKKWVIATRKYDDIKNQEHLEDQHREFIDLMFTENVVPAYFPHILMALEAKSGLMSSHVGASDELSSYRHCYQAFITHALITKARVAPQNIGGYHAALSELAYYMYEQEKTNFTETEIAGFVQKFEDRYMRLPDDFIKNLMNSGLLTKGLLDVRMHEYVFYYYVAKHLAHNFNNDSRREKVKGEIEKILAGAHRKRNGQILLFLIHHMPKSSYLLDKLNEDMGILFGDFPEATLTCVELAPLRKFFDYLPKPVEIEFNISEEQRQDNRHKKITQDEMRNQSDREITSSSEERENNAALISISKSLRMMNIAGTLLKNEYATMEKDALTRLSADVRSIALRMISLFHRELAENPEAIQNYFNNLLEKKSRVWRDKLPHEKAQLLHMLIGALTMDIAYSMIDRCVSCIGSDKLTALISDISDGDISPSHHLVHLVTGMWYGKNLDLKTVESLYERWKKTNMVSAKLLQHFVVQYTHLHQIPMSERQRIASCLDLSVKGQSLIEYKLSKR